MWRNQADPWFNRNHQGTKTRRLGVLVSWWSAALLCLLALLAMSAGHPPRLAGRTKSAIRNPKSAIEVSYARLPLSFEANQGQTDEQVKFVSRGSGYTLFLTGTEAVLALNQPQPAPPKSGRTQRDAPMERWRPAGLGGFSQLLTPPGAGKMPALHTQEGATLRLKLIGANPKPEVRGVEELPGKSNYFIGNDPSKWRTNVPNYAKVEYRDVYRGINLVHYGNGGQLEHDFVVSPGADPSVIRFAIEGADKMELDAQGDLVLHAGGGEARLRKPVVFQQVDGGRQEVRGGYVVRPGSQSAIRDLSRRSREPQSEIAFQVGSYDPTRPLVIDPVLVYSTYFTAGQAIAVDSSGNAYVCGGDTVKKINPDGSALVYSTVIGGASCGGIAVDGAGSAYVTGYTTSTNFPTVSPLQDTYGGAYDAFVAKLNAAGSALVYSTYLGGSDEDHGRSIAVDSSGNAYVTGQTSSTNFPTVGSLQAANSGNSDAFVAKLNAAGSALVYSTYLGGSSSDWGTGIAGDSSGNVYITGYTYSTNFPTASPLQATKVGFDNDAFVAKLNAAGSALVYSTYLGGNGSDFAQGIAVDGAGNAYVTGLTGSTNFPAVGPLQATNSGGLDAFVAKLNAAGSALVYSTYLGGSGEDGGYRIAVDASGNVYITGYTYSPNFPTASALQATMRGNSDAFVAKLDAAGSALVYSTYLGGSSYDYGYGIAVDASGSAYVTGNTSSANFPTVSPLQASGGWFVAKIAEAGAGCAYSISPVGQGVSSSGAAGSVTVTAPTGCLWGAASNATWVAITAGSDGSGNGTVSYSVAANTSTSPRTGTLTIAGQTFTVTQSGRGILGAGAVEAMPGATARIPITVTIESGVSVDRLSFGLSVLANVSAPPLTANLAFQQDPVVPAPMLDTSGGAGSITVSWQGLAPALSGTIKLGEVLAPVPATATGGHSYTVQITAASASLAGTSVPMLKGPNALLTVTTVNPAPTLASLSPSNGAQGGAAFTLTATGASFIQGSVLRWNGADRTTMFVSSTHLTAAIPGSDLTATGVATVTVFNPAPGGGESTGLPFTISVPNPAPAISSLSPASATAGSAAFNLTVNGTSFLSNSVVRWNGADRPTAYSSATQLVAPISAGDIMAAGTAQVTVFNPAPGGGTSNAINFPVNLSAPPAAIVKISGDGQSGAAGTALASPLIVQVNSAAGSGIPGVVVSFAVTAGSATLSTQTAVTNSSGQAQVSVTLGTTPGAVGITASAAGVSPAVVFGATSTAREPAALTVVSGNNQTAAAGSALADALVVKVADQYGNPVPGITVSFAVTGGAASLSAPTATTGSDGKAQVNVTLGTTPGTVTISASVTGVSPAQTFTATATVGPAVAPAIVSGNNQTAAVGTALASPLVVKIADQYGNPLSGVGVSFSVTAGSGTPSTSSALTNSSGQAQVTLTLGTTAGTVTVNATISGVATPATFTATATPGSPASLAIVSGNGQTAIGGSLLPNPLVTKLTDQYSNPVPGITVLFSVASGAGSLSASSVITDSNGRAQVIWRLGSVGAEHAVHASAGTLPAVTFTATAITGSPALLSVVSGNEQAATVGTMLPNPLVVKLTDEYSNPVPGVTVSFVVTAGSGTLSASSSTTAANGQTQTSVTLGTAAGTVTVRASVAGVSAPVSLTATALAGALASLSAVSGDRQTGVVGSTLTNPLVVKVSDQYGNGVSGVTVNFAVTGGVGTVSAASAITASNGQAQVNWVLGSTAGVNTVQASAGALTPVVFTATGVTATVAVGTVSTASVSGSPGGSARIPVTLSMNSPATVDSVAFGLRVEAVGAAPALRDALSLAKDAAMAEPTFSDTSAGPGTISVGWLSLATALSGTVRLGEVVVPIPALATDGQTYTVRITGASGSLGTTNMALLAGASVTLSVVERSYLVGDAFPFGTDQNADGDKDDAGEFGDDQLQILDLIYALRAVTSVPGYRPPACSDRFDAIDSHPADTPTVRGGNGTLNTVDLIYTLRRVTNVDTSRPRRYSRNLPCTAGAGPELVAQAFQPAPVGPREPAGRLQFGSPMTAEGGAVRVPVYLQAARDLELAGLSVAFSALGSGSLRFVNGETKAPTLVDAELPGVLAVAWLEGLQMAAGQRLLLGYVVAPGLAPGTGTLQFIGISASAPDGSEVRVAQASLPVRE